MNRLIRSRTPAIPSVDVTAAHSRASGILLLDVREPDEFAHAHAPGAHLLPLGELGRAQLPAARSIHVICRSGNRSAMATRWLIENGHDAYNVEGGMIAWARQRLPVEEG